LHNSGTLEMHGEYRTMLEANFLRSLLALIPCLLACGVAAVEPCAPFEGGRVDAQILATMRQAAREGRGCTGSMRMSPGWGSAYAISARGVSR